MISAFEMKNKFKTIISKIALSIFVPVFFILAIAPSVSAENIEGSEILLHSWGSKRLDATIWGISCSELDNKTNSGLIFLEENKIWSAHIQSNELVEDASYKWNTQTSAIRLYTMDLDDDHRDEIIVSAVANSISPASMILKFDGKTFTPLLQNIPWHLRVIELNGSKVLIGQRSVPDNFFTGKFYKLSLDTSGKKIVRGDALKLKQPMRIFEFTPLPEKDGNKIVVTAKGYASLKAYELRGKRWKRFWTSAQRFGGTMRYIELKSRPPTQDLPEYDIPIYREPEFFNMFGQPGLVAIKQDLPLKNIIAQKTLIRGGRLVVFTEDPSLGFNETFTTKRLPGYVTDVCVAKSSSENEIKLFAVIQNDPEVFQPSKQSSVLMFNVLKNNGARLGTVKQGEAR